ncbi:MAG: endonuclease/exonuclease/phosphatase family protein [Pseudobdellovibrionaceae bacterium]
MIIKVLSYNIHKGFTLFNTRYVLSHIKEAIESVGAQIVLLQEVGSQKPTEEQFEFLADNLYPHYSYGKNAVKTNSHHGNAILSAFPLTWSENINISNNRFEKRGLLHAAISIPKINQELHVFNVHLDLLETGRNNQIAKGILRSENHVPQNAPLIFGGDFNDWQEKITETLEKKMHLHEAHFKIKGAHAKTFPSAFPTLALDRLYFRNLKIKKATAMTGTPWSDLSDHLALYAEFEIDPKPAP